MDVDLTVKNYRCFSEAKPLRLRLKSGYTALVGANNSGKSAILRFFYEFRSIFNSIPGRNQDFMAAITGKEADLDIPPSVLEKEDLFHNRNDRGIELSLRFPNVTGRTPIQELERVTIQVTRPDGRWTAKVFASQGEISIPPVQLRGTILHRNDNGQAVVDIQPLMDVFAKLRDSIYLSPFRFIGPFKSGPTTRTSPTFLSSQDILVGQDFIERWRNAQSGGKRESKAIEQLTRDIGKVFRFDSLSIYAAPNGDSLHVTINGEGFKLHEVGTGLSQFIVVLGNVALKKPAFILIDEPESNLHPALQREFLNLLGDYASDGVIFATHSYGLARSIADPPYTVKMLSSGESELRELSAVRNLSEFLGELSLSGYQELGFEKILLVEGPTDVHPMQAFLRKVKKDHRVVILPLGGRTMINGNCHAQLEEIKRITPQIYALVDSERESERASPHADALAFCETCKKANVTCHILERRSLENYFSEKAIKAVKSHKYRALAAYERLEDSTPAWDKSENGKIALQMEIADIEKTDLGRFLIEL
jgi:predicted ATPase